MLTELLARADDPSAADDLRRLVADHVADLCASAGGGDATVVDRVESAVAADPGRAFAFNPAGHATLTAGGWHGPAGQFETPTIGELRRRVAGGAGGGAARLWVLDGVGPATDVGGLQATTADRPLFQVASQFNCLESPGPTLCRVAHYFSDPTQGPRAAVSAFPAALLRHYAAPAPDGGRFVQEDGGPQLDLLADAFGHGRSPVRGGYLCDTGRFGADAVVAALTDGFDRIRVGVHDAAPVVLGYDWDGSVDRPRAVAQVFTSTVAGGYGGREALGAGFEPACRQLLRAAYLGTLLVAAALGRSPVVLTLIGGGVFGNPVGLIWDAILWAFDEVRPLAADRLDVVINGRDLLQRMGADAVLSGVRPRGGVVARFDQGGLAGIDR